MTTLCNHRNRAITCGKQPGHLAADPLHKFIPDAPATLEWLHDETGEVQS